MSMSVQPKCVQQQKTTFKMLIFLAKQSVRAGNVSVRQSTGCHI